MSVLFYPPGGTAREAGPGRAFVEVGPCTLVVSASRNGRPLTDLCLESLPWALELLGRLSADQRELRTYCRSADPAGLSPVGRAMLGAALAVGDPSMTSMAAVAGAVADEIADRLMAAGATKATVNNGGDIAVRLREGESVGIGLVPALSGGGVDEVLRVAWGDGVGGVATSGLGGRSLTRGIADSVTVMAARCAAADAFATYLANCSYVESPRVHLRKARAIDPLSDIGDLDVVCAVEPLADAEVERGLERIAREAEYLIARGDIVSARASIQGRKVVVSADGTRFDASYRRAG